MENENSEDFSFFVEGSGQKVGKGHIDAFHQGHVLGWACQDLSGSSVDLIVEVNGEFAREIETSSPRSDLANMGVAEKNKCGFEEEVNVYPFLLEEGENKLSVRFSDSGDYLQGSPHEIPKPDIRYNLDKISSDSIHGWLYDANYVELEVSLDFFFNGKKISTIEVNHDRQDLLVAGHPKAHCGFFLDLTKVMEFGEFGSITAKISGTDISVFKRPIAIEPFGAKISALTELAKILRGSVQDKKNNSHDWLLLDLIPSMIENARKTHGRSLPAKYSGQKMCWGGGVPRLVDVVVPVYKGLQETLDCINSVLEADSSIGYRLVVINDKSPDEELTLTLRDHARKHDYLLLENEENLGFVGTVNRGMAFSSGTDVVLLNSDTLVPHGWLDQLSSAAYTEPTIGTVTPFSNNATICSYPDFCQDNQIPEGMSVNDLNEFFKKANANQVVDLPTAHGFCMFIKRATLDEVGLFDDDTWGKGYGEENDFSLRAERHGWRNVMAVDSFVQHLGSVSFAENTEQFIANNLEVLNELYPDYARRVASFVHRDPVRYYRNNVALLQLKEEVGKSEAIFPAKGKTMLFISLTFGGGTQVATDDMAAYLKKEGQCVLMLSSPKAGVWRLSSHVTNAHIEYYWPEEKNKLINDLKMLDVWHVHYHHTIEFPKEIWQLPTLLEVHYDVTIHDYFTICPRVNLIDETRYYCGEPPIAGCEGCIKKNGPHEGVRFGISEYGRSVAEWKAFHENVLSYARKVFAPSNDAAQRVSRHYPEVDVTVRLHPEPIQEAVIKPKKPGVITNVAFIGAIGYHKGYKYLVDCARYAERFQLPLHFSVIGYTVDDYSLKDFGNITVYGSYRQEELPKLIEDSGCTVAALLSVWPETFSYTFSEAVRNGLKTVSFDLGAFVERQDATPGKLLPRDASIKMICESLIDMADIDTEESYTVGKEYGSLISDYYEV